MQNYHLADISGYTYVVRECNCMVQSTQNGSE